jgi:phage tail sheath protein FI
MAAALTAPGVYIEEIPSGSRTITGVSQSLTAFVGRARRGPIDEPTRIFSFADYERRFGGLWVSSPMSQSVRHFFANGGSEALIVRVVNNSDTDGAVAAAATLPGTSAAMTLRATAAALALVNFDHLTLKTTRTGGANSTTYTILVEAKDAANVTLAPAGTAQSYTINVDTTGDVTTTIANAGLKLVVVNGSAVTSVPTDATVTTSAVGATHRATIGTGPSTSILEATPEAVALPGFSHIEAIVAVGSPTTFSLTIAAKDAANVTLRSGGVPQAYTVNVDLAAANLAAVLDGAVTPTSRPIQLVTLSGPAGTAVPAAGATRSKPSGGTRDATIAVTAGLELEAADAGAWGNNLRAAVSTTDAPSGTFHLTLTELDGSGSVVSEEVFYRIAVAATSPRNVTRVLATESRLARTSGTLPAIVPDATVNPVSFTDGDDGEEPRVTQDLQGSETDKTGIYALQKADIFNLLCVPMTSWSTANAAHVALWTNAATLCERRRAFLIVDPPSEWSTFDAASTAAATFLPRSANAALYFPRVKLADPLQEGRLGEFAPCGLVAGVTARTDGQRGVWKAPAGTDASLRGVQELSVKLTDPQQGVLNQLGINCVRLFPVVGPVVWGARTLAGADQQASEWKYVPVRRLALFIEESLYRGSRWAVFEPNDEPLWAQLRLAIGGFMTQLFRQGAFQGQTPREAYFVKCDKETTTSGDVDRGIVNIVIGFAPLKPAEFVIIKLQQLTESAVQ